MKIRGFVLIMVAMAFAFAPAKLNANGNYRVKLISPVAGQVLYGGQKIMIEWKHTVPSIFGECESEAWRLLDGGITFMWIAFLWAAGSYFLWMDPYTHINLAVLAIYIGCLVLTFL